MSRGINLIGGSANLKGLDIYMQKEIGIPVTVPDDPDSIIARGIGAIVEDLENHRNIVLSQKDELPFR